MTVLFVADIHFLFHNSFILYAKHVLDSEKILCLYLCILTILTRSILIRSLKFFLFLDYIVCFFVLDGLVLSVFDSHC
jgi:hypothetical protein